MRSNALLCALSLATTFLALSPSALAGEPSCEAQMQKLDAALQGSQILACSNESDPQAALAKLVEQVKKAEAGHGPAANALSDIYAQIGQGWRDADKESQSLPAPNTGDQCQAVGAIKHLVALDPAFDKAKQNFSAALDPLYSARDDFKREFAAPSGLSAELIAKFSGRNERCAPEEASVAALEHLFAETAFNCDTEFYDFHHPVDYRVEECREAGDIYGYADRFDAPEGAK